MKKYFNADVITTGLAVFSMFFGAGNVIFPLALGKAAGMQAPWALMGFLLTAVGIPFLGLISMSYFNGNYESFFYRIGRIPGSIFVFVIMALIGPFAVMPRLITVSHAAIKMYLPQLSLLPFALVSAVVIFFFSVKKSRILEMLGTVLSPILLISLGIIIIKALTSSGSYSVSQEPRSQIFLHGLLYGYNTMDLYASIFFSTVILSLLRMKRAKNHLNTEDNQLLARQVLSSGGIAAFLLAIVYVGLGLAAASFSNHLDGVASDEILSSIAYKLLGSFAGIVSSTAVALACLTTAITLACVFADFLRTKVGRTRLSYPMSLAITLIITTIFASLGFEGIMKFLIPVLSVIYPASIVLTICNILYKMWGINMVKIPVFATIIGTLILQLLPFFGW